MTFLGESGLQYCQISIMSLLYSALWHDMDDDTDIGNAEVSSAHATTYETTNIEK